MSNQAASSANYKKFFTFSLVLFVTTFFIIYYSTFISISIHWLDFGDAYGHGFLVLATAAYILYDDRIKFLATVDKPFTLLLLLNLVLSCFWFIGQFLDIQILQQIILPALILSSCGALFGRKTFIQLFFLTSLIYLSIPIWDYLTEPLQSIATFIVGKVLYWIGIPTHISGFYVDIPSGKFEIAGGCAGVRYLTAGMMISLIYGYWYGNSVKDKIYLFVAGIFLSLLSNWVRIFLIIVIGHLTEMKSSLIADHDNFGWILFSIMLIFYFFIGNKLLTNNNHNDKIKINSHPPATKLADKLMPRGKILAMLFIATFSAPLVGNYFISEFPPVYEKILIQPSAEDWRATSSINKQIGLDWQPHFFGASAKEHFVYTDSKRNTINLFLYSYMNESQKEGELINYNNTIADKDFWEIDQKQTETIEVNSEYIKTKAHIITNRRNGNKKLTLSFYMVNGKFTISKLKAKLLTLKSFISQNSLPPTLVAYSIDCSRTCNDEFIILQQFVKDTGQQIQ